MSTEQSSWAAIVGSVKTPLGFFALVVLASEALIGGLGRNLTGTSLVVLLLVMLGVLAAVVAVVAVNIPRLTVADADTDASVDAEVVTTDSTQTHDVFLAAPMAAFESDEEYVKARREVMDIIQALEDACGYEVTSALVQCETMDDFNTASVSADQDLANIANSRIFVMIYPRPLRSSVIFEAGYALALNKFCVFFVERKEDLPFMMQDVATIYPHVRLHELPLQDGYEGIVEAIRRDREGLFHVAQNPLSVSTTANKSPRS